MFGGADVVLFGIQAGVRLFGEARQAYVEKTQRRSITLPLPGVEHAATTGDARNYFRATAEGKKHRAENVRLRELHAEVSKGVDRFETDNPEGAKEYREFFEYYDALDRGARAGDFTVDEIVVINSIGQWRRGEGNPTALRRIAGTLVDIGVDYFATGPGAGKLSGNSPAKVIVRDVLKALDHETFVTAGLETAVEKVFLATLDSLAENPTLLSGDPKTQKFVSSVAKGVVSDVREKIEAKKEHERLFAGDRLGPLAGMVFRSVVRNGAETVLANPETFLGVKKGGESALVTSLGTTLLDVVLAKDSKGVDLESLFTQETLDKVVKGALGVVAEHPELLGLGDKDAGIRKILQEVAGGLAAETRKLGPGLFPDVVRLVLERTGANLHLVWNLEDDKPENLVLAGAKTLLAELARKPAAGEKWRPKLSKSQILNVMESVFDELADNPRIITTTLDGNPVLQEVMEIVLGELAKFELDDFSGDTVVELIKIALKAAAERWALLEKVPGGGDDAKVALAAVLDAVFASVTKAPTSAAAWTLAKGSVVTAILSATLAKLGEKGASQQNLEGLQAVLDQTRKDLAKGRFTIVEFTDRLEQKLAA